jgi:2-polyprenyl-6-methoxyphenol hydroxylase-like FAD-dependent oxidoreductase
MRHTDIAIAGAGLAGSTAAAMLGRAGIDAVAIDPHPVYPPDFRCEKLDGSQVELLHKTGLTDAVLPAATLDGEVWIARFGRLVQKRPNAQYDILYDTLVNTMRGQIPPAVEVVHAKVTAIATSDDRQRLTLSDGSEISARLIVLANGLNIGLRHTLGMTREVVSECHSISIGFDMAPRGRASFDFPALTYYPARPSDQMAYMTLFPIGSTMRANLFVYRDMRDPWLRRLREAPQETLFAAMPGLRKLTGEFDVGDPIKIRPVDLYVTDGYRQAGIVLVGDAFATSCPAAGTGANKVFTDVERLCNVHIPRWLASPGMGEDKIAAFYDDEVKQACDAHSTAKAYYLRALSTDAGFIWRARRYSRFLGQLGLGTLRQARERLSPRSPAARAGAAMIARGG